MNMETYMSRESNWIESTEFRDDFNSISSLSIHARRLLVDNKKRVVLVASIAKQFVINFYVLGLAIAGPEIVPLSIGVNCFAISIWVRRAIIALINTQRRRGWGFFGALAIRQRIVSELNDVFINFPRNSRA